MTIIKKVDDVWKKITIKGTAVKFPETMAAQDKRVNRPVFNYDGSAIYFMDKNSGFVVKGSLS